MKGIEGRQAAHARCSVGRQGSGWKHMTTSHLTLRLSQLFAWAACSIAR